MNVVCCLLIFEGLSLYSFARDDSSPNLAMSKVIGLTSKESVDALSEYESVEIRYLHLQAAEWVDKGIFISLEGEYIEKMDAWEKRLCIAFGLHHHDIYLWNSRIFIVFNRSGGEDFTYVRLEDGVWRIARDVGDRELARFLLLSKAWPLSPNPDRFNEWVNDHYFKRFELPRNIKRAQEVLGKLSAMMPKLRKVWVEMAIRAGIPLGGIPFK